MGSNKISTLTPTTHSSSRSTKGPDKLLEPKKTYKRQPPHRLTTWISYFTTPLLNGSSETTIQRQQAYFQRYVDDTWTTKLIQRSPSPILSKAQEAASTFCKNSSSTCILFFPDEWTLWVPSRRPLTLPTTFCNGETMNMEAKLDLLGWEASQLSNSSPLATTRSSGRFQDLINKNKCPTTRPAAAPWKINQKQSCCCCHGSGIQVLWFI